MNNTLEKITDNKKLIARLQQAVRAKENISGLTHNFYRYPARFSPKFVREIIQVFSQPGDVILDPFVGGGTTLVEALASNRHSIGFDVSPIASFVSHAKITSLSETDLEKISKWADFVLQKRIVGYRSSMTFYDEEGYLNNLPWRIKKSVEIILEDVQLLKTDEKQRFAKCVLLKTAQSAIDCRKTTPTTKDFRDKFSQNLKIFSKGVSELSKVIAKHSKEDSAPLCFCINDSSETINDCEELNLLPSKPKLVITSPPYIGVHMLYHQWQVNSRKRTRTPFWIINSLDGQGSGHYTFGYYQSHAKKAYFEIAEKIFTSIHSAIHDDGIIVQLVGFSDHKKYLCKYLEMMSAAGYEEVPIITDKLNRIKRIWRNVPNRKWYNITKNEVSSSKEVLLVHRKKVIMAISTVQELFNQLLKTTTPLAVRNILTDIGDVGEIGLDKPFGKLRLHWHPYGDKTSNYSTIGLASKPGRSITERITNAIDAVLEEHSLRVPTRPNSPQAAANEWFGRPYSNFDAGLFNWKYSEGNYDRKVGVILNDSGKEEAPTVDILDFGVGILPENFASTILSLHGGNKITKKYLVGAFGQGGATTLAFCDYVLVISRHIQNPNVVSFTLIKEITLGEEYKENCYAYLAVSNENGEKTVPYFALNESINIYDTTEKLRLNEFKHGTLVRHYSFRLTNIFKAIGPREGNLYHYLHISLFDPLIPFQIIDLRKKGEKPNQQISTGSRNRLMKLTSKEDSELDNSNSKCKLYRPFAYIKPHGANTGCVRIEYWVVFNEEKKKNKKTGVDFYDLRPESNSLYVQKRHLAVLTLNGQNQGELTVSQVSKDLGLDSVSKHLIIHIDATEAPKSVKNQLFTTNREMLKDQDVLKSIIEELRRILSDDNELIAIEKELEDKAISEVTESTDDEVKKQIVKLLRDIGFTPSTEGDTTRRGEGDNTDNPPPPTPPPPPSPIPIAPLPTLPYPDVTRFEIISPKTKMEIHLNKTGLVLVETDADSRYKDDIKMKIEPESLESSSYFPLHSGRIKWRLKTSETARIGDKGKISVSLTKPNGDQLRDEIEFEVLEAKQKPSKEEKGFIPDFEVLPTTPGDDNWDKAWENISEESEERFSVAYIIRKIGNKTIVFYSTVYSHFKAMTDKLKITGSPLYKFFETNYKVWIGYHAILQFNSQQNDTPDSDELEKRIEQEKEKERALIAQMQVKQALNSSELMFSLQKQKAVFSDF